MLQGGPPQDVKIDRQGAYTLSMHQSQAEVSLSLGLAHFFVLCFLHNRRSTCIGAMQVFDLRVSFPTIVTNRKANVAKAFNTTLEWHLLHCGCHLIHYIVKAGLGGSSCIGCEKDQFLVVEAYLGEKG